MLRKSLALLLVLATVAEARPIRRPAVRGSPVVQAPQYRPVPNTATEALHEVNAERRKRGLRPFIMDHNLTIGALNVASFSS